MDILVYIVAAFYLWLVGYCFYVSLWGKA